MQADWWYSDKFGPVGPFALKELREVLSTFEEDRLQDVHVWREGSSERKSAASPDDFREQDDFWSSEKLGTQPFFTQVKDTLASAGKSYWSRLRGEFFRNRQSARGRRMRDKIGRRHAREIDKVIRPAPTIAAKVLAGCIIGIAALFIIGLLSPNTSTTSREPLIWRAHRSDICAMTGLSGLSMDDERALRGACWGR